MPPDAVGAGQYGDGAGGGMPAGTSYQTGSAGVPMPAPAAPAAPAGPAPMPAPAPAQAIPGQGPAAIPAAPAAPGYPTPPGQPAGMPDPWAQEVPAHVREALGVEGLENYGQLRDQFGHMKQRADLFETQQQFLSDLMRENEQLRAGGQAGALGDQQQAQQPQQQPWIGPGGVFPSQEALVAAYRADPNMVEERRRAWYAQGMQPGAADPALQQRIDALEAQNREAAWRQNLAVVEQRYDQFRDPAVTAEVNKFIGQHATWAQQVQAAVPSVPIAEILAKAGDYDRIHKELGAYRAKMGEVRNEAGTARTSVGAPGQVQAQAPTTHGDAVSRVVQRWRAEGKPLPDNWEQYAQMVGQPQI